jgi:DNA-binding LytR/AlgR family response regulator
MQKLKTLIIDDEPLARKGMREYVEDVAFLELVGEAENPLQADALLKQMPVDLLLCDIQMPKMRGIDFVKLLSHPPMVIFTTAYPEYALEGYDLNIIDYLLKPIGFDRFYKAVQKAQDYYSLKNSTPTEQATASVNSNGYIFVKVNNLFEKIVLAELLYVEAVQNYVRFVMEGQKKLLSYLTLSQVEAILPAQQFTKTHKSFLVNVAKVDKVGSDMVYIGAAEIPIGRTVKEAVVQSITENKVLRRNSP